MSSTAPAQEKQIAIGDRICSSSSTYKVESFVGQGTFGTVAKCKRKADKKTVAIKMMKREGSIIYQATAEMAALSKLRSLDPDKCNIVRWYQAFTARGHICLEFEALDKSLHDFMKERLFRPLLLKEIRPIIQQIATALVHLKSAGMIHADIKLQNVMLVNHAREPYRVKVIDFGLACDVSDAEVGWYIQSRPYRAPEILLGLPFTEAIDMWSLGCIAASLYLGDLLYPGRSEYDMISYIVETQGQFPDHLLSAGQKTHSFFDVDNMSNPNLWRLKTPQQYYAESGIQSQETRRMKFRSLYALMDICPIQSDNPADKFTALSDKLFFMDMLSDMLELDAAKRLTPQQVLEHQFISMSSIVSTNPISAYVQSSLALMEVCQSHTQTSDSGKAQQNFPPPADPLPCTKTQTSGSVNLGIKRKADDEDGNQVKLQGDKGSSASSDSGQYKKSSDNRKRFRKSTEGPSTSNCSSQTQSPASPRLKRKQSQDKYYEDSHHERKRVRKSPEGPSTSSSSSLTKSPGPARLKRKNSQAEDNVDSDHERKRVRKSPPEPSTCSSNTPDVGVLSEHHGSTKASISSQTESGARSGLKRKAADDGTADLMSGKERKRAAMW